MIDRLAQEAWEKECQGNVEILNDNIYKHYFMIGFKLGFQNGNVRPPMEVNTVPMFKSGMISNKGMEQTMCMQLRITPEQYQKKLNEFLDAQTLINKLYKNDAEINLHWMNWLRKQVSSGNVKPSSNNGRL